MGRTRAALGAAALAALMVVAVACAPPPAAGPKAQVVYTQHNTWTSMGGGSQSSGTIGNVGTASGYFDVTFAGSNGQTYRTATGTLTPGQRAVFTFWFYDPFTTVRIGKLATVPRPVGAATVTNPRLTTLLRTCTDPDVCTWHATGTFDVSAAMCQRATVDILLSTGFVTRGASGPVQGPATAVWTASFEAAASGPAPTLQLLQTVCVPS